MAVSIGVFEHLNSGCLDMCDLRGRSEKRVVETTWLLLSGDSPNLYVRHGCEILKAKAQGVRDDAGWFHQTNAYFCFTMI